VTVIYPPQPAPVIINQYGSDYPAPPARPRMYEPPVESTGDSYATPSETAHYLLAFKDHTIYSAIAYWVDGDTLHYFTAGNTHNQASLSLIDRDLTQRLNQESGVEVKLPAPRQ
jgi:endonuclease YncB( thermonuclease family)